MSRVYETVLVLVLLAVLAVGLAGLLAAFLAGDTQVITLDEHLFVSPVYVPLQLFVCVPYS